MLEMTKFSLSLYSLHIEPHLPSCISEWVHRFIVPLVNPTYQFLMSHTIYNKSLDVTSFILINQSVLS